MKGKIESIISKIIKCKHLYYAITIILIVMTFYIDLKNKIIENKLPDDANHLKYFLIIAIVMGAVIFINTFFIKIINNKIKPHILYLLLALFLGGIYIFAIPLGAQSDEPAHILRAVQTARGEIISPIKDHAYVTQIPKSVLDVINVGTETRKKEYKRYYDIKQMVDIELNNKEKTEVQTVGNYPGLIYIPQAIGIEIGKVLNLNTYYTLMIGRITGLLIIIGIITLAIKKIPKFKMFMLLLMISPVAISYIACYSADGMILACTCLFISEIIYYIYNKCKIKKIDYFILAILTIMLAISKMAYIPLIALLLFIPKECFKTNKNGIAFKIAYILLGIIVALLWTKITNTGVVDIPEEATNRWIYSNPIGYLIVLFRTTMQNAYTYIEDAFGAHYLCHNQVKTYGIVALAYIIICVMSYFNEENKEKVSFMKKLIFIGSILLTYVMISTAMYVFNTSYKNGIIIGVQGRYLIPLMIVPLLLTHKKKVNFDNSNFINIALILNYCVSLTMITVFLV